MVKTANKKIVIHKKKPGRKLGSDMAYTWDEKLKQRWLKSYAKARSVVGACRSVKVSTGHFYLVTNSESKYYDEKFVQAKNEIDEKINDTVEARMFGLTRISTGAGIFWLTNRRPDKWTNTQNVKHDGQVGITLTDLMGVLQGK